MPSDASWVNILLNAGTAAFMLWWFAFRMSPAMTDLARSVDRIARTLVTLTLTVAQHLNHCEAVTEQCDAYKKELDEAEKAREAK